MCRQENQYDKVHRQITPLMQFTTLKITLKRHYQDAETHLYKENSRIHEVQSVVHPQSYAHQSRQSRFHSKELRSTHQLTWKRVRSVSGIAHILSRSSSASVSRSQESNRSLMPCCSSPNPSMYSSLRRAGDSGTKGMDSSGCWRMEDKEELRGDMGALPVRGP